MTDQNKLAQILDSLSSEQCEPEAEQDIPDERLKLIFTCCHPALNQQSQVALTLKTVCGLTVKEIARAYIISEAAMHQRLLRAKKKIQATGIGYEIPEKSQLDNRLDSVLTAIYLIYNESYSAFEGQSLTRKELAEESIRLARVLYSLLPEPEVGGLLALMLLHQSRQSSRSSTEQNFIPLERQDRSQWNQTKMREGRALLLHCLSLGKPDKYQLQAAISALHSEAQDWSKTDWLQIRLLYLELYKKMPSPVVKLNAFIALAHCGDVQQAAQGIEMLENDLADYKPFYAAQADILSTLGKQSLAKASYLKAIAMTSNQAEKSFLIAQLAKLDCSNIRQKTNVATSGYAVHVT
jgi:RNA polymerase sigma-70 factor (ECF subfamily)